MKKTYIILFLLFHFTIIGQSFKKDIQKALTEHEKANNALDQYKALQSMELVTKNYSNEWLPYFWAAYQSTQMEMLKSQKDFPDELKSINFLDNSENYLQITKNKFENLLDRIDSKIESDWYALKALILTFKEIKADDNDVKRVKLLKKEAFHKALMLNHYSPTMMVFAATELGRKQDATYAELFAAVYLMESAKQKFSESEVDRSLTTHFNEEWIRFWLPYLSKKLSNLIISK